MTVAPRSSHSFASSAAAVLPLPNHELKPMMMRRFIATPDSGRLILDLRESFIEAFRELVDQILRLNLKFCSREKR
jgi:hypothetical protein